jgi:hypothetical protein
MVLSDRVEPCPTRRLAPLTIAGGLLTLALALPAAAQEPASSMLFPLEELPEAAPTSDTAETPAPAQEPAVAENFPASLVGSSVGTVMDQLRAEGWMVVARSPGLVQFDKNQMGLDLTVTNGQVVQAEVIDLI